MGERPSLDSLTGRLVSRELGVTVQTVVLGAQGMDSGGVVIVAVEPDGFADRVGLRRGDIILALGDQEIADVGDLRRVLEEFDPEAPIVFRLQRGDRTIEYIVE